jgi:hypothetical protein
MTGLAGSFQARRRIIEQRGKLLIVEIVGPNVAGGDGIDPAMELHVAFAQLKRDRGMGAKMIEL